MPSGGEPAGGGGARPSTSARGRAGEALVASALEAEGWILLARNFRAGRGEIDLVAARGDTLAFVEVKSWRSLGSGDLGDSIGGDKRRRIVETAKIFLVRNRQYRYLRARFDVALVRGGEIVRRIESAFTGDL
ncbi:MAG: YraN family protein [Spirochaetaceae bacterium]|nr:YraN family protein [Spirochaetaceae bacterium]